MKYFCGKVLNLPKKKAIKNTFETIQFLDW